MGTTVDKLNKLLATKQALKTAINAKGGTITDTTTFADYVGQVEGLSGGGAELNIHYGLDAPTDTSKLWVKTENTPSAVKVSNLIGGSVEYGMASGIASLPKATYDMACGVVGSKVYLFGGCTKLSTINVFDTTDNTITKLSTALPNGAEGITCGVVGSKVYLFGGYYYETGTNYHNLSTINVFDTTDNTITTLSTTLPNGGCRIACGVVGSKIYLFGGKREAGGSSTYLSTINVFDTTDNTITTLSTTLPTGACSIACEVVGTKIYLFGGRTSTSTKLSTINVFDTTDNTITTLSTTFPTGVYGIACEVVGTKIYLFGGGSSTYLSTINVFDTTDNTITTLSTTLPTGACGIACGVVGSKIYLFGGCLSGSYLSTINAFTVSIPLTTNSILLLTTSAFPNVAIIKSDTVNIKVGASQCYLGNTDNVAEVVKIAAHNGTEWVELN